MPQILTIWYRSVLRGGHGFYVPDCVAAVWVWAAELGAVSPPTQGFQLLVTDEGGVHLQLLAVPDYDQASIVANQKLAEIGEYIYIYIQHYQHDVPVTLHS